MSLRYGPLNLSLGLGYFVSCTPPNTCTTYTSSFLTFTITRRCNSTTHKSMSCSVLIKIFCTENGTRTHTDLSAQQILSLSCLPIPSSRHLLYQIVKEQFILLNNILNIVLFVKYSIFLIHNWCLRGNRTYSHILKSS